MSDDLLGDQLEDYPHPREALSLFGHARAEAEFLDAYRSGRMHHAWILAGPEGIGKATLAYRIAKFLFAFPRPEMAAHAKDLSVAADSVAFRRVSAQGHADLFVLRRTLNDKGKLRSEIVVDDARAITERIYQSAGEGGWRVCIVDAADEWNRNTANALLKTLEEPPPRTIFLLICHQPGRLLPTIRSRARLLEMTALTGVDLRAAVESVAWEADGAAVDDAMAAAGGSVRRALTLLDKDIADVGDMTRALLDRLPALNFSAVMALADKVAGRKGDAAFAECEHAIREWLNLTVHRHTGRGAAAVAPLAEIWDQFGRNLSTMDAYNLDRKPFITGLFSDMAEAMRRLKAA